MLRVAKQATAQKRKNQTAIAREKNLQIRTAAMGEIERDNGTLQKSRSTSDLSRNPCSVVYQAARYPGHTVNGRKAGIARRLCTSCSVVMD